MTKLEAVDEAVKQSREANGERRYAVKWINRRTGITQWVVEKHKPALAAECLLAVDGKLEHA
jgi:hypothetical protein